MPDEDQEIVAPPPASEAELQDADNKPITAREFRELVESNKVAQGQARRAEEVSRQTQGAVQALFERLDRANTPAKVEKATDEIEGLLDRLDDSDPALAAVKVAIKHERAQRVADREELNAVKAHIRRQEFTKQQQEARDYVVTESVDLLDGLVKPEEVRQALAHLPATATDTELWAEAKKFIKRQRRTPAATDDQEERIRRAETAERDRVEKQLGVFRDRRPSGGAGGGSLSTYLNMSREERAKLTPEQIDAMTNRR